MDWAVTRKIYERITYSSDYSDLFWLITIYGLERNEFGSEIIRESDIKIDYDF